MTGSDPHIHVEQKVLESSAEMRNVIVSMLGRAADAPTVVTAGCGQQVPYAMTSTRPESVTCLPCREHARREYLRFAEQVEQLSRIPGAPMVGGEAAEIMARLHDFAKRYSD